MNLILDDPSGKNAVKFLEVRGKKLKPYRPEDIVFAKHLQPSTKGSIIDVSYQLEITRDFGKKQIFKIKDVPGIIIPITLNPGIK